MKIKIKEAIKHYNDNVKPKEFQKMSQRSLGLSVIPGNGDFYISNWSNGKQMSKLKPEHIHKICEACSVDANFLYGIKPMFQSIHLGGGKNFSNKSDVVIKFNKKTP